MLLYTAAVFAQATVGTIIFGGKLFQIHQLYLCEELE
jgi:hypothetical protein